MGEGPTLTTVRLLAVPLTLWNAGVAAEELAPLLYRADGTYGPTQLDQLRDALRRELRRRATASPQTLTWMVKETGGGGAGMLAVDVQGRGAVVTVTVGPAYRGRGYATEVLRAVAAWLEAKWQVVVEARIAPDDGPAEALARRAGFVPTDLVVDGLRSWVRPLPHARDQPADAGSRYGS